MSARASAEEGARSCVVCPNVATSTTANAGHGWLLLPTLSDPTLLLEELASYAAAEEVSFDATRAAETLRRTKEAVSFVEAAAGVTFEPVPAPEDPFVPRCKHVQQCCTEGERLVDGYGDYTCKDARRWFTGSGCCDKNGDRAETPLLSKTSTWPPYLHLKNQLDGQVKWTMRSGKEVYQVDLVRSLLNHTGISLVEGETVTNVKKQPTGWELTSTNKTALQKWTTPTLIFASGGFGAILTADEKKVLGVSDTRKHVHARNDGLLWRVAQQQGWPRDALNAWFLEFESTGAPKWFLWEPRSTVLQEETGRLLYNEAASYDERGRKRRRQNATASAYHIYEDPTSTKTVRSHLGPKYVAALASSEVQKECDGRSERLWRNFLVDSYGVGSKRATRDECAARVGPDTPVQITRLAHGIIDTISGPKVDTEQRVAPGVFACGNAVAPGLLGAYVAPGSTLGNALVTGYVAGRAAGRRGA